MTFKKFRKKWVIYLTLLVVRPLVRIGMKSNLTHESFLETFTKSCEKSFAEELAYKTPPIIVSAREVWSIKIIAIILNKYTKGKLFISRKEIATALIEAKTRAYNNHINGLRSKRQTS